MASKQDNGDCRRLPDLVYMVLGYVGGYSNGVHGYSLGRRLSETPLGLPSLRLGQLYRVLHQLQGAGLVKSQVENAGPRPARYRFTVTPQGRSNFRDWLLRLPNGDGSVREHVLDRLRFSTRLPLEALQRMLECGVQRCEDELVVMKEGRRERDALLGEACALHSLAVEARLAADRRWLEEVRVLAERSREESSFVPPIPPPMLRSSI